MLDTTSNVEKNVSTPCRERVNIISYDKFHNLSVLI
jgi:hypothetical protein